MRKSGLHKQIASIFDGVPVPENRDSASEQPAGQHEIAEPGVTVPLEVAQSAPRAVAQVQPEGAGKTDTYARTPAVTTMRPRALPKKICQPQKPKGPGLTDQMKKAVYGSKSGQVDPRQKKMTVMVGVLAAVFGVVMFFSFGGVGQTGSTETAQETVASETSAQGKKDIVENWKVPEPVPDELRDPMQPVSAEAAGNAVSGNDPESGDNQESEKVVVRGIVFSQNRASAIINDKIVVEGQTVSGIKVVGITRDQVEFEKDGKRWTQQVQR